MTRTMMMSAMLACAALSLPAAAEAKGCLKGAAVGAVGGHMVGHGHAMAGAAAGCAAGHMHAKHKMMKRR